jgi:hypothetical protein
MVRSRQMKMTIGRIMEFILRKHVEALLNPSIHKPFAWALYETWKWVDENEKPRKVVENGEIAGK